MEQERLLKADEAAQLLGIGKATLYVLVREGKVGHVQHLGKKRPQLYIPSSEVTRYIKDNTTFNRRKAKGEELKVLQDRMAHARSKRKYLAKKEEKPQEYIDGEPTIYLLRLKPRTLNVLQREGLVLIRQVDFLTDEEARPRITRLRGFGLSSYIDLKEKLADYHGVSTKVS